MTGTVVAAVLWAADATPSPTPSPPPIDPERVTPGILGLVSFVFLVVAVFLLYRSMRKQFTKIDPNLPEGPSDRARDADRDAILAAEARGEAEAAARRARAATDPAAGRDQAAGRDASPGSEGPSRPTRT